MSMLTGVMDCNQEPDRSGKVLGKPAKERESRVGVREGNEQNPEYHETRETLWEVGGTTPQG